MEILIVFSLEPGQLLFAASNAIRNLKNGDIHQQTRNNMRFQVEKHRAITWSVCSRAIKTATKLGRVHGANAAPSFAII